MNNPEWLTWETDTHGWLTLEDGRRIFVKHGDELLCDMDGDEIIAWIEHRPRTIN